MYFNNSSDVTFSAPLATCTLNAFSLNGLAINASFWTDVDTRFGKAAASCACSAKSFTVNWNHFVCCDTVLCFSWARRLIAAETYLKKREHGADPGDFRWKRLVSLLFGSILVFHPIMQNRVERAQALHGICGWVQERRARAGRFIELNDLAQNASCLKLLHHDRVALIGAMMTSPTSSKADGRNAAAPAGAHRCNLPLPGGTAACALL